MSMKNRKMNMRKKMNMEKKMILNEIFEMKMILFEMKIEKMMI
jgi:hypothetical protein